jgi:DNA-binding NtrC family response regulator
MFAPENKQILVLHEDDLTLGRLQETLLSFGYPATPCRTMQDALSLAADRDFDLALLSLGACGTDSHSFAPPLRHHRPGLPVIVMVPLRDLEAALASLDEGADDYITLPPHPAEMRLRMERILAARDQDTTMALLRDEATGKAGVRQFVAQSEAMRDVAERIRLIAPMRSTVLILGESGAGKELAARAVHCASLRAAGPFVALNCSAIPESLIESELFGHERGAFTGAVARTQGKFELAHTGTLFLDEIGEMNPAAQVKLLRVLEEREFMRVGGVKAIRVEVRVLAATNTDLEQLVTAGRFRRDLYYRLNVVRLRIPPLRERKEDLPILVRLFMEQICRLNNLPSRRISDEVVALFERYSWPGNVRELKNLLESLLVSTPRDILTPLDLPPGIRQPQEGAAPWFDPRPAMSLEEMERELIRRTLEHTKGNRTRAALLLRIGIRTLQRKIARYALR